MMKTGSQAPPLMKLVTPNAAKKIMQSTGVGAKVTMSHRKVLNQ